LSNYFPGIDIVDVARIKNSIENYKGKFLNKIFSEEEQSYCFSKANPYIHFAGKFAAKEAVIKSLLSSKNIKQIGFLNIFILNDDKGTPIVKIKDLTENDIKVSISHTESQAIAFAIFNLEK